MDSPAITSLSNPVSDRLRSSVIIPTLPQALSELVQNSLDAGASRIECWIDLSPGNESIRIQDDGHGIDEEGMKRVGERHGQSLISMLGLGTGLTECSLEQVKSGASADSDIWIWISR